MNYKKLAEEFKSYLDDNFIDNEIKKEIKKEINKSFVRCMFPDIKLAIGVYFTEYSIKFYGVFSNDLLGSNSLYSNFLNKLNSMDSIFKFYTNNIDGRDLFFYKYVFYC
ncbi:MAG: hypothetical protein LBM93_10605, partial [Oscillospiraceae bacterium]|nr:hypothetical protein [Oscillospiraceae bacterium]